MSSTLKEFMPAETRDRLGNLPTYHGNCLFATTGCKESPVHAYREPVARPGKTARDRVNKEKTKK